MKRILSILSLAAVALALPPDGHASTPAAGTVVATRGRATIERDAREEAAKVRDPVFLPDRVATGESSRAKLLFVDDSVLTLGERTKVSIREYVLSKEGGGRSIFNLLDGKLRAVVGKGAFEVHTATAVAAARGTVILFETGVRQGRRYTLVICLEGEVEVTSLSPGKGSAALRQGTAVEVFENEPVPPPSASPSEAARLVRETSVEGYEVTIPDPARARQEGPALAGPARGGKGSPPGTRGGHGAGRHGGDGAAGTGWGLLIPPPISQEPAAATLPSLLGGSGSTPVSVGITF